MVHHRCAMIRDDDDRHTVVEPEFNGSGRR